MFRTRGRPNDPWNVVAAQREKELAETIQVCHIKCQNGDQKTESFAWTDANRQREQTRQHTHDEVYKDLQYDRLRRPNGWDRSKKSFRDMRPKPPKETGYNSPRSGFLRLLPIRSKTAGSGQPALRAPPRIPKHGDVPSRYKEAALAKAKTNNPWAFSRKFKEIMRLQEKIAATEAEEEAHLDLLKELEEAEMMVDVGNAQLERIQNIIEETKIKKNERLYSVQAKAAEQPKSKLLVTLNDVNERIRKLQKQFFDNSRPRYKSVNSIYRSKEIKERLKWLEEEAKEAQLMEEVKVENQSTATPKQESAQEIDFSRENLDGESNKPVTFYAGDEATKFQELLQSFREAIKDNPELEVPPINTNFDDMPEENDVRYGSHRSNQNQSCTVHPRNIQEKKPRDFREKLARQFEEQLSRDFREEPDGVSGMDFKENWDASEDFTDFESEYESKLRSSVFKSDFLMKDLDMRPQTKNFRTANPTVKNRNKEFTSIVLKKLEGAMSSQNGERQPKSFSTTTMNYLLKRTLFCPDN